MVVLLILAAAAPRLAPDAHASVEGVGVSDAANKMMVDGRRRRVLYNSNVLKPLRRVKRLRRRRLEEDYSGNFAHRAISLNLHKSNPWKSKFELNF